MCIIESEGAPGGSDAKVLDVRTKRNCSLTTNLLHLCEVPMKIDFRRLPFFLTFVFVTLNILHFSVSNVHVNTTNL